MRLIDADAVEETLRKIEEITAMSHIELGEEYDGIGEISIPMHTVRNIIKTTPTIDADRPQEWIPCSEKLPSNFSEVETVLATTDVDGDRVIVMFALDVKSFYLKGYVTAWMPLPEPWKGANDDSSIMDYSGSRNDPYDRAEPAAEAYSKRHKGQGQHI